MEQDPESYGKVPQAGGLTRRAWAASESDWNDWHWQLRHRVTSFEELAQYLPFHAARCEQRQQILSDFKMAVTPYYLSLIDPDDAMDPIARQSIPGFDELRYRDTGEQDPLHEDVLSPVPGLTHRYPDRVLMVLSNDCAMYCRHCTRKRLMATGKVPRLDINAMLAYIARTPQIRDVILSGGDPLLLTTAKLESILKRLRAIEHVEMIRIGTRVPCVLPQRVDKELCEMLSRYHPVWMNVQFEHPRECTPEAAKACDALLRAGVPINNQSVLLRGVNDDAVTMRQLLHKLMRMRVRPYYLFHCDPVFGAEHFRTSLAHGIDIMDQLRGHTSGLAVPTYVVDLPGGGGKVPVGPKYLLDYDQVSGRALLRNYQGRQFEVQDPVLEPNLDATLATANASGAPACANNHSTLLVSNGINETGLLH